jgi:hypothetical protein
VLADLGVRAIEVEPLLREIGYDDARIASLCEQDIVR